MGKIINVHKILIETPKGERPLVRPGRKWEDGIKLSLKNYIMRVLVVFTLA
jgi:hypothetical protein